MLETSGEIISVRQLIAVLTGAWLQLCAALLLGAACGAVFAFLSPNIYRGTVILAPVKSDSGLASGLRNQLGGLAAIAGIDIGNGNGITRNVEAIATFGSIGFIRDFVNDENLLPVLFARQWDSIGKKWRADVEPPTSDDGAVKIREKVLSIAEDRKTGLVTINVDWSDRQLAAQWANLLVERINARMRSRAIEESRRSIEYLEKELSKTTVVDLRQAIYGLIESQINSAMIANVQPEYVFKVIDKAVPSDPKRKVGPRRAVIASVGGVIAAFFWSAAILWRQRKRWVYA